MCVKIQSASEIYDSVPYELQLLINKYIKKWQWNHCISRIHNSKEWRQSYTYRKYKWFLNGDISSDGVSVDVVTAMNRSKYDIADTLRYEDFISGQKLVSAIVPMWHQFRIEPSVKDIIKLPYSTNVLAYAYSEYMANHRIISSHDTDSQIPGAQTVAYYARDMLSAVASDLVGRTQLMTHCAKLRCPQYMQLKPHPDLPSITSSGSNRSYIQNIGGQNNNGQNNSRNITVVKH